MELIRTKPVTKIILTKPVWGRCSVCRWTHRAFYAEGNKDNKSHAYKLLDKLHYEAQKKCPGRVSVAE